MAGDRRHRLATAPLLAVLLLAGCGQADDAGLADAEISSPPVPDPGSSLSPEGSAPGQQDVARLIDRALAARVNNDPEFAPLLRAARDACPDPSASRRLGDAAAIAARWSAAALDGRPKAQAVTEGLLDKFEWDALVDACVTASE